MTKPIKFLPLLPLLVILVVLASRQLYQLPVQQATDYLQQHGYVIDNVREQVEQIAQAPHPTGSEEIKRVRDHLVTVLKGLGADVEVQQADAAAVMFDEQLFARVENVVARFKGTDSAQGNPHKALLLLSHYDSFDHSLGAADDGYGVATIIETMRVLNNAGPLKNDVIVVFTDAEERGTLGIKAFVEQHRYAKDIGLVINFEARGSHGPVRLFETSSANSALLGEFAAAAPFAMADSFFYSLYGIMGNYTDMTVTKSHGWPGLNLAFSEGFYDYHTLGDSAENLSSESLIHAGTYALALTRHFANRPLPVTEAQDPQAMTSPENQAAMGGDSTFFNLSGSYFVHYASSVAYLAALLVLGLFILLLRKERRAGRLKVRAVLGSMLVVFLHLLTVLVLANGLNGMIGGGPVAGFFGYSGFYALLAAPDHVLGGLLLLILAFHFAWLHLVIKGTPGTGLLLQSGLVIAVAAFESALIPVLVVLVLVLISAIVTKKHFSHGAVPLAAESDPDDQLSVKLFYGFLALWTTFSVLSALLLPGLNHIFVWPLLAVLIGRCVVLYWPATGIDSNNSKGLWLTVVAGLIPVLWWSAYIPLIYSAVGHLAPGIPLLFAVLTAGLLVPLTAALMKNYLGVPALILAVAGVGVFTLVLSGQHFDLRYRQPSEIFYLADQVNDDYRWASFDGELHQWLTPYLGEKPEAGDVSRLYPAGQSKKLHLGPAPTAKVTPLAVTEFDSQPHEQGRRLSFTLKPAAAAIFVNLYFNQPQRIKAASVNGQAVELLPQAIDGEPAQWWRWQYYGLPIEGAQVVLDIDGDQPLALRITEVNAGLPAELTELPDLRPDNTMSRSYGYFNDSFSDSTVIVTEHQL